MNIRPLRPVALVAASLALWSCGGGESPTAAATPTVAPTVTTAPTTRPTPTPAPCTVGLCEGAITNTNPPERLFTKVYWVRKPNSALTAPCSIDDGPPRPEGPINFAFPAIPVGYSVAIDLTPFDAANRPTNGDSNVTWRFDGTDNLIDDVGYGNIFQPKFTVTRAGNFQIQARMRKANGDILPAPWLWLKFVERPEDSPCAG